MKKQISLSLEPEILQKLHLSQADQIVSNGKYVSLNSIISKILEENLKK